MAGRSNPRKSPSIRRSTWHRHAALSLSLSVCSVVFLHLLHLNVTGTNWDLFFRSRGLDGPHIQIQHLTHNWLTDHLNPNCGVWKNRLILAEYASVEMQSAVPVDSNDWQVSMGFQPVNGWSMPFRRTDLDGGRLKLSIRGDDKPLAHFTVDTNNPLHLSLPDNKDWAVATGSASSPSLIDAPPPPKPLRHSLVLAARHGTLTAWLDGEARGSIKIPKDLGEITIKMTTPADACLMLDNLQIHGLDNDGTSNLLFEDTFDARPLRIGWAGPPLDGFGGWATVFVCSALLLLLIDACATGWTRGEETAEKLLAAALPGGLLLLVIQSILELPFLPVCTAIAVSWLSKCVIGLSVARPGEDAAPVEIVDTTRRPVFWFVVCAAQAIHGWWFLLIWPVTGMGTFVAAALGPAMIAAAASLRRRPAFHSRAVPVRILATAGCLLCVEIGIRGLPIERLADIEWRNSSVFWDLLKYTDLLKSPDNPFVDTNGNRFDLGSADEQTRIICLGSSTTEGIGGSDSQYPTILAEILDDCAPGNFEVISAAKGGYNLTRLRVYFEDVLSKLDPDLVVFYYGVNGDRPQDMDYYKSAQALLAQNPDIGYPGEMHAAMALGPVHPVFLRTYLLASQSRIFTGLALVAQSLEDALRDRLGLEGTNGIPHKRVAPPTSAKDFSPVQEKAWLESAELLVEAVVGSGARILLIPEVTSEGYFHPYGSIFSVLHENHPPYEVLLFEPTDLDRSNLVDHCHMNDAGYLALAETIAEQLVARGLVTCGHSGRSRHTKGGS